jgi:cysteinyl-tRNA synthetase
MANYWMHNGFVQVDGKKMAKSDGNFVTINELLHNWKGRAWPGAAVRWAMLQTHYREPFDWTLSHLARSAEEVLGFLNLFRAYYRDAAGNFDFATAKATLGAVEPSAQVIDALCDDLNTPRAITAIRSFKARRTRDLSVQLIRDLVFLGVLKDSDIRYYSTSHGVESDVADKDTVMLTATNYQMARANGDYEFAAELSKQLAERGLQIVENDSSSIVISKGSVNFEETVRSLISQRNQARQAKNFAESDRIRDELTKMGVVLKDTKDGTTWEIAR